MLIVAVALALGACATSIPTSSRCYGAQRMSHVYDATVLSVRPVTIDGSQSGVGAGAGAIVGGIAGSTVGGQQRRGDRRRARRGASAASSATRSSATRRKQNGVEIIVQLRNGERRADRPGARPPMPGRPAIR